MYNFKEINGKKNSSDTQNFFSDVYKILGVIIIFFNLFKMLNESVGTKTCLFRNKITKNDTSFL